MSGLVLAGSFDAAGIGITISTDREELASAIRDTFRDLLVDGPRRDVVAFDVTSRDVHRHAHSWVVWRNGERRETVGDDYVLPYLMWEVSRLVFDRGLDRLRLHAAAVVIERRAVVLAGRSRAGKSTLAAWLVHRGWGFLADEAALVDPGTVTVAPYWRPIGVRTPGPLDEIDAVRKVREARARPDPADAWSVIRERRRPRDLLVPASSLGELAAESALGHIVFPQRVGEGTELVTVTPGEALVELARHYPALREQGRSGFRLLGSLAATVPAYVLRYRDLEAAEAALHAMRRQT